MDEAPQPGFRDPWLALGVAGAALFAEFAIAHLAVVAPAQPAVAAFFHLLVGGGLCLWVWMLWRDGRDIRVPALLALTTCLTGPFGPVGTLVTLAYGQALCRKATSFQDWYESLFPQEDTAAGTEVMGLVHAVIESPENQSNVAPLIDVLSFGDHLQKQAVVSLVTKHYQSAFAPVLRQALRDEDNAIRVQAATAASKLETKFLERAMALSRKLARNPGDTAMLRTLAQHYDDYAFSGILDPNRELETREEALKTWQKYVGHNPEDTAGRLAVGRLLVRLERYQEAEAWLKQGGFDTPAVVLWRLEALFAMGEHRELRALAQSEYARLRDAGIPSKALSAVAIWAGLREENAA